jgi:multimeric flavodoxin WrbA
MTVMAFNGSPRKDGNTAKLLRKALEGAASQGAETEFIQLNTLSMKGCQGCFSCKKRGGESYGKCILKDDMTPLYAQIEAAEALFLGAPIYFGSVTAELKMVIDRMFPYLNFGTFGTNFPKKISVGLVYTLGADETQLADALEPLVEGKRKHLEEAFPKDCEKAFEMGARFVRGADV